MKILLLNKEDICRVFKMSDAMTAAADSLAEYSSGRCSIPLRTNLDVPEHNGQSLYMQGYCAGSGALGVKIVSVYPDNIAKGLTSVPATMILLDEATGETCAMIDGTWLTRLRTGAVSGAATALLARSDAREGALFGTGGQAETQLEAMLTARPSIERVRVFDAVADRAAAFADRMGRHPAAAATEIVAAATADEAIADAEVVTTVTTSKTAVFDGAKLRAGAHVNAVGSYTPQMAELPAAALKRASKIYVDTRDGALRESGDFLIPFANGDISPDKVTGELGELVLGRVPGRENDDEITVFETVGTAALDLVTAKRIYAAALAAGVGTAVEM